MKLQVYLSLLPEIFNGIPLRDEPGSSVSIVSGYGLDDLGSRFDPWQKQRIFPLASVSRPNLGPTLLYNGYGGGLCFPRGLSTTET
jgi:hypothetical protein